MVKSSTKPDAWTLSPQMTAAPEMWRDIRGLWPFWNGGGDVIDLVTTDRGVLRSAGNGNDPVWGLDERGAKMDFVRVDWVDGGYVDTQWMEITGSANRTWFGLFTCTADLAPGFYSRLVDMGTDSSGQKWGIRYDESNNDALRLEHGGGFITGSTAINDGALHTFCITLEGSTLSDATIYLDGKEETLSNSAGTGVTINTGTANNMNIGIALDDQQSPWDGSVHLIGAAERAWPSSWVRAFHEDPFAMLRPAGF